MTKEKWGLIGLIACVIGTGETDNILIQIIVSLSCLVVAIYCFKKVNRLAKQDD